MEVVPFNGGGGSGEHSISQSCEREGEGGPGLRSLHAPFRDVAFYPGSWRAELPNPVGSRSVWCRLPLTSVGDPPGRPSVHLAAKNVILMRGYYSELGICGLSQPATQIKVPPCSVLSWIASLLHLW